MSSQPPASQSLGQSSQTETDTSPPPHSEMQVFKQFDHQLSLQIVILITFNIPCFSMSMSVFVFNCFPLRVQLPQRSWSRDQGVQGEIHNYSGSVQIIVIYCQGHHKDSDSQQWNRRCQVYQEHQEVELRELRLGESYQGEFDCILLYIECLD